MRKPLRALAVAAAGLLAALVLLEIGLRVAGLVAGAMGMRERPAVSPDGRPVVLFVGDSNIFGMHVAKEEALPAQSEALSRESAPPGFLAANKGQVGSPSWVALARVRESMSRLHPAAVVVRVGINNRIIANPDTDSWWEQLRIVRLTRIWLTDVATQRMRREAEEAARRGAALGDFDAPGEKVLVTRVADRDGERIPFVSKSAESQDYAAAVRPGLRRDLVEIERVAKRYGARVFYLSYFDEFYLFADVNEDLKWAAAETGSVFVDMAAVGKRALALRDRGELVFNDFHCTALGYRLEAAELLRAMIGAGAIRGAKPNDPIATLESMPADRPALSLATGSGEALAFTISTKPGLGGRLLLGNPGSMTLFQLHRLPIADDAVSKAANESREMRFQANERGEARVEVPAAIRALLPKNPRAVAMVMIATGDGSFRWVASPPLDF